MFIALLIFLAGLMLAGDILFSIKALKRGERLAFNGSFDSFVIFCTSCGTKNKRQFHEQICRKCYKPF
ncbi:hypothetical protein [Metabacillus sp. FJAT-52054]|uniref:Uncharacterized protein n=1 Tax=Metabacillus sediminis TaxID=3117746 RepID=A0ABZ2NL77_9BACI